MSTKKIKVDTETFKKVQQSIITEQHKELRKNLSVEQAKKLEETDKIITKVETNLIDNENSNLHIIKNLSVDLKALFLKSINNFVLEILLFISSCLFIFSSTLINCFIFTSLLIVYCYNITLQLLSD